MLFRDEKSNKFDLHPVVRKYCYDRLRDKKGVHSELRDYFAKNPEPEKIESVDDLAPIVELYYHTVRAGRYDEAAKLFKDRLLSIGRVKLHDQLYYRFGAYQPIIELLRTLFPDGEDKTPRLKDKSDQEWIICALANSYSLSGQSRRAVPLFVLCVKLMEKIDDKKSLINDLTNFASLAQIPIGELDAAESNLRRSIEICREIKDEILEALGHQDLGLLLAYRGNFEESKKEITKVVDTFEKLNYDYEETAWIRCSLRAILMNNAAEALNHAKKARKLGERGGYVGKLEIDIIRAEYLLGAAHLMKGNLVEAEEHLTEALTRDRKINLVELEPDILLVFAKLRLKQNHKKEALKHAEEALLIADRCEYRLKQADIHNFLAEFYLDAGDFKKAKKHGEIAKERAECGYKPALEKAEKLLNAIELR
jgi:tetratricopeptide (TPR) repeat protein